MRDEFYCPFSYHFNPNSDKRNCKITKKRCDQPRAPTYIRCPTYKQQKRLESCFVKE